MNRPLTERVAIELGDRSYAILVGPGLLDEATHYALPGAGRHAVIVTNVTVAPLLADRLRTALAPSFDRVEVVTLPDGESHKDWSTLNLIFDALLASGADRRTTLFALGGGVIGDMTGFAAACYMRGVAYVQVPTTLLAQVDSSVGGKTAINHPLGKNMIGVFNQPRLVVADTDTLATLPPREMRAGLAEVIKYGATLDDAFLGWIERHLDALLAHDDAALVHAVRRCCELKARVVAQDEREAGLRAVLNFGHTFGHAIEAGLGFGTWLHGEAVAAGMVMAADLSVTLGLVAPPVAGRLRALVERAGLPVCGPALGSGRYLQLMRGDKKSEAGSIRFVLLDAPGSAVVRGAPDDVVARVLDRNVSATVG